MATVPSMQMACEAICGNWGPGFWSIVENLAAKMKSLPYEFMPDEAFAEILETASKDKNLAIANKILWEENLSRARFAAAITILRTHRWMRSSLINYNDRNYLAFAATLRGLLEASADSHRCLRNVGSTIAAKFHDINLAVNGSLNDHLMACQELEDELIHFSHARKSTTEKLPKSHIARTNRDYINALASEDCSLHELYAELCNVTHPAAGSIVCFVNPLDATGSLFEIDPNVEAVWLEALCKRSQSALEELLQVPINEALVVLKLINRFNLPPLITAVAEEYNVEHLTVWKQVLQAIELSSQTENL